MSAFFLLDASLVRFVARFGGGSFPPPLLGMFAIIAALAALEAAFGTPAAAAVEAAAAPAVEWIGRWLPLFYVPSLVTLPLALQALPSSLLAKVGAILCAGWMASLLFAACVTVAIRAMTATELQPAPPRHAGRGFTRAHSTSWAAAAAVAWVALQAAPVQHLPLVASAFLLASTVCGFLLGTSLPSRAQRLLHPLLVTAAVTNVAAALAGAARGGALGGYAHVLQAYLTKRAAAAGAGDFLMAFLHSVILSFGFRVFSQRSLMRRHCAEISGAVISSAVFSLLATAAAGAAAGLPPDLTLAIAPRSVTVALALPIAGQLGAAQWASVTATAVMFTGLLGANFAQPLLSALGFRDPIVRGLATAASAHGLGTAALAATEPQALPVAALAYAALGVASSLLISVPQFRAVVLALAGAA
jgi:putative effector of murein hydrolase